MRIALVHLCSYGDCLYATLVARQIKRDFPGCHLTWVIGDKYASLLEGNPRIDAVEIVPIRDVADALTDAWRTAKERVEARLAGGEFDRVFSTQIIPENRANYDSLIRSTVYRSYGRPVDGPHRPELELNAHERDRAAAFADRHSFSSYRHVFLFECGPQSGQSAMSPKRAEAIARRVADEHPDALFCLSSSLPIANPSRQIVDAASLSFRENAALSHFCTGLIGCSSGITWLTTSTAGRLLPMLQVLTAETAPFRFASVTADFARYDLDQNLVIELADPSDDRIVECIETWTSQSHALARERFHQQLRQGKSHAREIYWYVRNHCGRIAACRAVCRFVRFNGVGAMPWSVVPGEVLQSLREAKRAIVDLLQSGLKRVGLFPFARAAWRWLRHRDPHSGLRRGSQDVP
jgi:hypothetical protein